MEEMEKSDFSENVLCTEGAEAVVILTISPSCVRIEGTPEPPPPLVPQVHPFPSATALFWSWKAAFVFLFLI